MSVEMLYSHVVPGWFASGTLATRAICSSGVSPSQDTPSFWYASFTFSLGVKPA
jgi:hypothetical protein